MRRRSPTAAPRQRLGRRSGLRPSREFRRVWLVCFANDIGKKDHAQLWP